MTWLGDRAADDAVDLEAFEASIDWNDEDLSLYGRLVVDFGKRLWTMSQEWSQWAAEQVAAAEPAGRPQREGNAGADLPDQDSSDD